MSVKIDGTSGIDVAQLRAPDGDPVALTIDALGKLAFPAQGQSLANPGYADLPGGLILQWGQATKPVSVGSVTVPFVKSFPNNALSVVIEKIGNVNGVTPVMTGLLNITAAGFDITVSDGTLAATYGWIALGY